MKKKYNFQKHIILLLRRITSIIFNKNDDKRFVKMFDFFCFRIEK